MATRHDIITLPNPRLRQESEIINSINESVKKLVGEMEQATLDWEDSREHEFGVALAAVQIDALQRVIVVRSDLDDKDNRAFDVYINPEITRYDGEPEFELEGCLSVKDVYGKVPRYPKIKIKALNLKGERIKFIAKGFKARMFQHEIDHINGITFVDRLGPDADYLKLHASGDMVELNLEELKVLVKDLEIDGTQRHEK